jgi:hypothetical protein
MLISFYRIYYLRLKHKIIIVFFLIIKKSKFNFCLYIWCDKKEPWEIQEKKPDENWPDLGSIKFVNYSVKYKCKQAQIERIQTNVSKNFNG